MKDTARTPDAGKQINLTIVRPTMALNGSLCQTRREIDMLAKLAPVTSNPSGMAAAPRYSVESSITDSSGFPSGVVGF